MKLLYTTTLVLSVLLSPLGLMAQSLEVSASEILHEIRGLKSVGSAMYLAAHPDDENTKVIAYLAREKQLNTSYLSLTRGDGGQNLIGTEIVDGLGVIRTQELLGARKHDHGKQYFTRAIDFGYSKNPEETFDKWQRAEVLKDVVWVIRQERPDLIITRFPPDSRAGHGHHTASAQLAIEALNAAKDREFKFNDARDGKTKPWTVHRIVWNTSYWWYQRNGLKIEEDQLYTEEVGAYHSLLGSSINSIASKARSSHRSQGFGDLIDRGTHTEYFSHLAGDSAKTSIFEDYDFSWYRFGNFNLAEKAERLINTIISSYKPQMPENSINKLIELKKMVSDINDEQWQEILTKKLDLLIARCAGLYCEVLVDRYYACNGDSITFSLNAINRSQKEVKTKFVDFGEFTYHIEEPTELHYNKLTEVVSRKVRIDAKDYGYSDPYWLREEKKDGLFQISNAEWIGKAELRPFQNATALFEIQGESIEISVPISYKWEDRVLGEQRRPFEVRPKVALNFDQSVIVATAGEKVEVEVNVLVNSPNIYGLCALEVPKGWSVSPSEYNFEGNYSGEIIPITFTLSPGRGASSGAIKAKVFEESTEYSQGLQVIKYDHIPTQLLMPKAICNLAYIDQSTNGQKIGYLMGAGDKVAEALSNLGYDITLLDPETVNKEILREYPTIVVGIRAYNTLDNIAHIHQLLMNYCEEGGKVISQYNTTGGLKNKVVGPYDLVPSRSRITDEHAKLTFLNASHPIFHKPLKITSADFDDWVQERGLYFPNGFDKKYSPLLRGNDPGEDPLEGMLIVTDYGKGQFVYTSLSFFRELPAGVVGAYRLLINLVEY